MSNGHGTPSIELGQFTVIANAVTSALPKALRGFNPKKLIHVVSRGGERIERALRVMLNSILPPSERIYEKIKFVATFELRVDEFKKADFFPDDNSNDLISFDEDFKRKILAGAPDTIPPFQGELSSFGFNLENIPYEWEIQKELRNPEPFSSEEVLAGIHDLIVN